MLEPLNEMAQAAHANAEEKGFWDPPPSFPEILALIHSEISEALEEYRRGHNIHEIYYTEGNKPNGIPIELADTILRILDYCGKENINIDEAVRITMAYNKTRPYRHGGKRL